jgi:hypothetical protein
MFFSDVFPLFVLKKERGRERTNNGSKNRFGLSYNRFFEELDTIVFVLRVPHETHTHRKRTIAGAQIR